MDNELRAGLREEIARLKREKADLSRWADEAAVILDWIVSEGESLEEYSGANLVDTAFWQIHDRVKEFRT